MELCKDCKFLDSDEFDYPCVDLGGGRSIKKLFEAVKKDNINHPFHYCGSIETIDYIKDKLTPDCFEGFLAGNVIKYISRYGKKNGLEDLRKAEWYLKKLIRTKEEAK